MIVSEIDAWGKLSKKCSKFIGKLERSTPNKNKNTSQHLMYYTVELSYTYKQNVPGLFAVIEAYICKLKDSYCMMYFS